MTNQIDEKLKELNINLPDAAKPAGSYLPVVQTGNLLFVSGQLPLIDGAITHKGKVGHDISVDEGAVAARHCAINILAQVKSHLGGDLARVKRVVKLGGFVNSLPGFCDHPKVVNGASNLMADIFGDLGQHARFAVGASSLPLDVAVEVEAIIEIA